MLLLELMKLYIMYNIVPLKLKLPLVLIYRAQNNKVRQPIRIILLIALQAHSYILNLYIVTGLWALAMEGYTPPFL